MTMLSVVVTLHYTHILPPASSNPRADMIKQEWIPLKTGNNEVVITLIILRYIISVIMSRLQQPQAEMIKQEWVPFWTEAFLNPL